MKTKVIHQRLLIVLVILTMSCSNKNLNFENRHSIILKYNESPKTGANNDKQDCITSAGSTSPKVKKECAVPLSETNILLEPVNNNENYAVNASIIFRKDENQAELFLPEKESIVLTRTKNTKDFVWKKNDWEFVIANGYALKRNGITVYQATL